MTIWLWKLLDNRFVDACLGTVVALSGLTVAAVLLPDGSGLESAAEFFAFFLILSLIWKFFAALFSRR